MKETPDPKDDTSAANRLTLEICFLAVVGLVVVAAFFEALTYQLVSSRTPFVIMVPLFALLVVQARRMYRERGKADFRARIRVALAGGVPALNKTVGLSLWMCGLLALITVFGHYAGILAFGLILMRWLAGESWTMALMVAVISTALIFVVFEIGFDVELYRGLLWRYFQGYRDFG